VMEADASVSRRRKYPSARQRRALRLGPIVQNKGGVYGPRGETGIGISIGDAERKGLAERQRSGDTLGALTRLGRRERVIVAPIGVRLAQFVVMPCSTMSANEPNRP